MMMQITRKEREELNALSKEVFGVSSKWSKLIEKGQTELVTEEQEETVPAEKEGEEPTTRKVTVPVLSATGAKQYVVKRHTVESVRELLLNYKTQLEALRQSLKEQQENAQAKERAEEQAKKLHEELSGSAIK